MNRRDERFGRRRAHGDRSDWSIPGRPRNADPELLELAVDYPKGESPERVGGRRRIRPEIVTPILALAFVASLVAKPWAWGTSPNNPSPPPIATAAAPTRPAATAAPTDPPTVVFIEPHRVDWQPLANPDVHDRWGVSTATIAPQVDAAGAAAPVATPIGSVADRVSGPSAGSAPSTSAAPTAAGPTVTPAPRGRVAFSWSAIDWTADSTAVISVPVERGRHVFGLAVTWPGDYPTDALRFTFDSPTQGSSGTTAIDGFPPGSALAVVPAPSVTARSEPTLVPGWPGRRIVVSGEYWVAPVDTLSIPYISPPADQWRFGPWWWPEGEYRIDISAGGESRMLIVRLVPTY